MSDFNNLFTILKLIICLFMWWSYLKIDVSDFRSFWLDIATYDDDDDEEQ